MVLAENLSRGYILFFDWNSSHLKTRMAPVHVCWVAFGCWWADSVPLDVHLSIRLIQGAYKVMGFPGGTCSEGPTYQCRKHKRWCGSWTMKKGAHQKIDVFELWCQRRLLRVPWTVNRSNQSTLKETNPEYSLEWLTLKLKLKYFGHLVQGSDWLEKALMQGKIEGKRRQGWQRMRWLDNIADSVDVNLSRLWEKVKDREACQTAIHGVTT